MDGVNHSGAQANNEPFVSLFGEKRSASEVKNLINQVRVNNITAENNREGLGKIYILLQNKGEKTPSLVSAAIASKIIKNGNRYKITIPNDNFMKEEVFKKNNEYKVDNKDLSAAYYYNGYLRVISIIEIKESKLEM